MYRYTQMAEEIIKDFSGTDIDGTIAKYASDNSLNINQQQRLIEEVNVGSFLNRLKSGTQHEDFPIAEAVQANTAVLELDKTASSGEGLDKTASYGAEQAPLLDMIDDSMFHMSLVEFDDTVAADVLSKTAGMYDDNLYAHEEKLSEADVLRKEAGDRRELELASLIEGDAKGEIVYSLSKMASRSEDEAKGIIVLMANLDLTKEAEDVLEDSKWSTSDIVEARVGEPGADAMLNITKLAGAKIDSAKEVAQDAGKIVSNASGLVAGIAKFPFKHPKTAAGLALVGYGAKKAGDNAAADDERLRASAYIQGGE